MITTNFCYLLMSSALAEEDYVTAESKITTANLGLIAAGAFGYWGVNQIPMDSLDSRSVPTGMDAWIEPQWNPQWEWTSDFLGVPYAHYGFNLPVITLITTTIWGGNTVSNWGITGPVIQSIAITATVTETTKRLVGRPRPYTSAAFEAKYPDVYNSEEMALMRSDIDSVKSFPSGHTSNAAATYFSTAAIIAHHSTNSSTDALAYGSAMLLTGLTGYSRVIYGKHHISDTLVGAAVGIAIGLSTPHIYQRLQ